MRHKRARIPVGTVFGRWTVTGDAVQREVAYYPCRCACGTARTVRGTELLNSGSTSCGCRRREALLAALTIHGACDTPEYKAWCSMKARCTVPTHKEFPNYGGRGIRVCDQWLHDFAAFLRDVGPRPDATHSLDRINNDGHYEPGNVRWALPVVQSINRRLVRFYAHNGLSLTIRQWAERTQMSYDTLRMRVARLGWPIDRALTEPLSLHHQAMSRRARARDLKPLAFNFSI